MKKTVFRPSLLAIFFAIGLIGLLFLGSIGQFLFNLELESLSWRQRMFSNPPQDRTHVAPIELITFDDKTAGSDTFKHLFGVPMSRSASAYIVRFFKRTQPKAVAFDLSYNGGVRYNDRAGDQALVDSLQGTNFFSSTLVFSMKREPTQSYGALSPRARTDLKNNAIRVKGLEAFPIYADYYSYQSLIPPFPDLFEKTPMRFYSSNYVVYSADPKSAEMDNGDSRRWAPFSIFGGHVFPTLALGVALNGERSLRLSPEGLLSWKGGQLNLGRDGFPLVKWYGHMAPPSFKAVYPETSFLDIVMSEIALECRESPEKTVCGQKGLPKEPPVNPERFKNKYVLIGLTTRSDADEHASIYGSRYSGMYIFANTLDNVLNRDFVYPAPTWLNLLSILLLPMLSWVAAIRYPAIKINMLLTLTLALGYFLLCMQAYNTWNLWLFVVYPILLQLLFFAGIYMYRYFVEHKKREQLRFAFGKYVAPAVMQLIEKHPERVVLGGERREMTFLFCDIRGFTTFSDNNPPEVVQQMLTRYFSAMNRIILHDYHGSINKLIGDAIMAYWGFPLENEDHAFLAVSAALAMKDAIQVWREDPQNPPINIGIGINTGDAVIGNIGSEDFMDFTVIGDAVNVASRLESANKEYGTNIIISAATYEKVKGRVQARSLGWASVRGKEAKVELFEPLALL